MLADFATMQLPTRAPAEKPLVDLAPTVVLGTACNLHADVPQPERVLSLRDRLLYFPASGPTCSAPAARHANSRHASRRVGAALVVEGSYDSISDVRTVEEICGRAGPFQQELRPRRSAGRPAATSPSFFKEALDATGLDGCARAASLQMQPLASVRAGEREKLTGERPHSDALLSFKSPETTPTASATPTPASSPPSQPEPPAARTDVAVEPPATMRSMSLPRETKPRSKVATAHVGDARTSPAPQIERILSPRDKQLYGPASDPSSLTTAAQHPDRRLASRTVSAGLVVDGSYDSVSDARPQMDVAGGAGWRYATDQAKLLPRPPAARRTPASPYRDASAAPYLAGEVQAATSASRQKPPRACSTDGGRQEMLAEGGHRPGALPSVKGGPVLLSRSEAKPRISAPPSSSPSPLSFRGGPTAARPQRHLPTASALAPTLRPFPRPPSAPGVREILDSVAGRRSITDTVKQASPVSCHRAMLVLGGEGMHHEVRVLSDALQHLGVSNEHSNASTMLAFHQAGRFDLAMRYFDDLYRKGTDVGPICASVLIKMCARLRNLPLALDIFYRLSEQSTLNRYTYNCLIHLCAVMGRCDEAITVLRMMHEDGGRDTSPDGYTYAAVLRAIDASKEWNHLTKVYRDLHRSQIEVDSEVWCLLISVAGKAGRPDLAKQFYDAFKAKGGGHVIHIDNALLSALAHNESLDKVMSTYYTMLEDGLEPDEYTFNALLTSMSRASASLFAIQDLVGEMTNRNMKVNTHLGTSLINAYRRSPEMAHGEPRLTTLLLERAHQVLSELAAQRMANSQTYCGVASMHAMLGDAAGVQLVLARMAAQGIAADGVTYLHLGKSCLEGCLSHMASQFFERAEAMGVSEIGSACRSTRKKGRKGSSKISGKARPAGAW